MASPSRRTATRVDETLHREPRQFGFFQAMRLLEILAFRRAKTAASVASERDKLDSSNEPIEQAPPPGTVGEDRSPEEEIVRFRALISHAFPASEIHSLTPRERDDDDDSLPSSESEEMVVTFMGLAGAAGVLPQHYTQLLIDRIRDRDFALRDFLDLFNHRLISHFYRAGRKYRLPLQYERAKLDPGVRDEDLFTQALYSLVGLGTSGLRSRLEVGDETYLYYSGQFSRSPPAAIDLEQMIEDYFEVPAQIVQFVGQWLYLEEEDMSRMPGRLEIRGDNDTLGMNVVAGERVWSIENKFRVRLGPLTYAQFRRFTPMGGQLHELGQFIRSFVGPDYDFDVQLILEGPEAPRSSPHEDEPQEGDPSFLGWNTWLFDEPLPQDLDDADFIHDGAPLAPNLSR